ncbi:vWA domain-containing protein [Geodermatophilus sp. URMC 64]
MTRRGRRRWAASLFRRLEMHSRHGVPTVRRVPVRRAARVRRDRRVPGWLFPVLAALLALGTLAVVWPFDTSPEAAPARLGDAQLGGDRALTGRACVVLASDLSGSMRQFAQDRREALHDLLDFSRRVLRPDDVVLVVTYADTMAVALPPTQVGDLPAGDLPEPDPGTDGTALTPVLQGTAELLAGQHCAATGLAGVTDGLLQDHAATLDAAVREAGVAQVHLLVPGGSGRPGPLSSPLLDDIQVGHFRPGDTEELGLAYGRLLALLTGQELRGR